MDANARRLRRQFYDVLRNFEALTGEREDGRFVWYSAAQMINKSGCKRKPELMEHIEQSLFEARYGDNPYQEMVLQSETYKNTEKRYRLISRVPELGEFWLDCIRKREIQTLEYVVDWLELVDTYFVPNIFKLITNWEIEIEQFEDRINMKERKKHYNQMRRNIKDIQQMFQNTVATMRLMEPDRLG